VCDLKTTKKWHTSVDPLSKDPPRKGQCNILKIPKLSFVQYLQPHKDDNLSTKTKWLDFKWLSNCPLLENFTVDKLLIAFSKT